MTEQPAGDEEFRDVASGLARVWSDRNLLDLAVPGVESMPVGTPTDWGLAAAVKSADSSVVPVSLGGGIPDPDTLPRHELNEAMSIALSLNDDDVLRYGGGLGYEPLRDALASRYSRDRGMEVSADHFMLTNGSAGAIEMVCSALLSTGDVVISEKPTFSGTLRTFHGKGAEIVSVPMDDEGMITEELAGTMDRLASQGRTVKFIYTISNFHNPTGVAMSLGRRRELLAIAANHSAFILDDDAYGDLYFRDPPPAALSSLSGGHGVITVGSFSKTIATGLRVGWIHTNPELIELISRVRFDMGNSPLIHYMLFHYLNSGQLDEHLDRMRGLYAEKIDALSDVLADVAEPYLTFRKPTGGFFLWVRLQDGLTADAVQRAGISEGVVFPVGSTFFPDQQAVDGEYLRLAFSWTSSDDLKLGAERLARACASIVE